MLRLRAPKGHPVFNLPILLLGLTLTGLAASLACASPLPSGPARSALAAIPTDAPSAVYPSIDEAVEAAFVAAEEGTGPAERERLRIGTIRRVPGGFAWVEPMVSSSDIGAMTPMEVRLRLGADDVAVYGLHPRSGLADVDRANETVTRHERRLVDERDPLHRPFYLLTPSRRMVRYPALPESVEVVRRDEEGASRP
jgi:hypothetical protein